MSRLFQILKDILRGYPVLGRSSQWDRVRKDFLRSHPVCAVCYTKKKLEVHHVIPFSVDSTKELLFDNLITLCRTDHFLFGHLNSWKSFNKTVRINTDVWRNKILDRP